MKTVKIRGEDWDTEYIRRMLDGLFEDPFYRQKWESRDALVLKDGSRATIYTGQDYDPSEMNLIRGFWDHDHCEACNWEMTDSMGEDHLYGYTNGYNWLCEECYRLFVTEDVLNLQKSNK